MAVATEVLLLILWKTPRDLPEAFHPLWSSGTLTDQDSSALCQENFRLSDELTPGLSIWLTHMIR